MTPEPTDYQRGYVDGFDAPVNVAARAEREALRAQLHETGLGSARWSRRGLTAEELLDVIDGIVDDTHPEGDGCPLCAALDDLRSTLDAERAATEALPRYRFVPDTFDSLARMDVDPDGEWVRYADIAALDQQEPKP